MLSRPRPNLFNSETDDFDKNQNRQLYAANLRHLYRPTLIFLLLTCSGRQVHDAQLTGVARRAVGREQSATRPVPSWSSG